VLVAESPGATDILLAGGPGSAVAVGRDPRGDVVVDHPGVSWRHLTITRRDASTWLVVDAGSTNGTLVDGRTVQATPIRAGDTLGLGDGPCYRLALRAQHAGGGTPDGAVGPDRTRVEVT
jgi:pSer/pThr/pTyr-binding forkhead associated (FHA) protein